MRKRIAVIATLAGVLLGVQTALAVDVKVDFDKVFDFTVVKTWGWSPKGPGELRMARSADDDPDAMRAQAEPIIMSAVMEEMGRRGVQPATGPPDLIVTYYLLLSSSASSQSIGQFLPATTVWAVPPYGGQTQSLEVMNQGSLVLDLTANEKIVWRGVARAKIKIGTEPDKRRQLLREGVRDLLKKFPPKK